MVQSLNWSNYSPNQILELKKNGVEVPEDVLKGAQTELDKQTSEEVTSSSDDNTNVGYTIQNTASQVNEAKELREQLEADGESLKSMVKTFTQASDEASELLTQSMQELSAFNNIINNNQTELQTLSSTIDDEQNIVISIAEDIQDEIEQKQNELDFLNEKIETGDASESDITKAEDLGVDIEQTANNGSAKIGDKTSVIKNAKSNINTVNSSINTISSKIQNSLENAQNGSELATETNDLSEKLYKKGLKAQKIGKIIGGIVGSVGGFMASKAITGNIANNKIEQQMSNYMENATYITSDGADQYKSQLQSEYNQKNLKYNIGSAVVGAGIGVSIGSLFGSSNIKTGLAGMKSAEQLNTLSSQTNSINTTLAELNGISIENINVTNTDVSDLDTTIAENSASIQNNANAEVSTAPKTTAISSDNNDVNDENNPNKKKTV